MADISIKKVFIDYVSRFEDTERGFSRLQRDTRSLKRDTDAWGKSFQSVVKDLKSAAKTKRSDAFDPDGLKDFADGLNDIEKQAQRLVGSGGLLRQLNAAFNIDPRVRRAAKEQLAVVQDYRAKLQAAAVDMRALRAKTQELANAENRLKDAIASRDKSGQLTSAHRVAALNEEVSALRQAADAHGDLGNTLGRADRDIRKGSTSIDSAANASSSFGDRINRLTARLRQVFPVLRGLAVIIVAALGPGIAAFAGGVIAATSALGGLAAAAGAAAGPALAVLGGFFSRLGSVMEAFQTRQQAMQRAQADSTSSSGALATALDQLRSSKQRASAATRSVATAERSLADATRSAAEEIAQASQRREDAWRNVQDAAREVAQTELDGLRAIKDAAEEASDAIRDVEHAKIGVQEARLDTKDAVDELRQLREEAGTIGPEFEAMFKKFTDVAVEFDPKALGAILADAGLDKGSEDARDIERAILRVREARLDERDAVDQVSDSERDLNDKRREANKLQRDGVAGFAPHIAAVRNLESAQRELTDATAEANRVQAQGIQNNPGVISAREALADANRGQAESERDLKRQMEETTAVQEGMTPAMRRYEEMRKRLSGAERGFLDQLIATKQGFTDLIRAGTDPIFASLSRVLQKFQDLKGTFAGGLGLAAVEGALRGIGGALGRVIENFADFATSVRGLDFFLVAANGARQLIDIIGGPVMKNFLGLWANLTEAFMPHLVRLTREFAGTIGRADKSTRNLGSGGAVKDLVASLESLIDLVGSVAAAFFAFGKASGPAFRELAGFIKEGFDSFTKWMNSAEGRKDLKKFFKETIPFAKAVLKFIVKLASLFAKIFQFLAPSLTDFFNALDDILNVLHVVVDVLNSMPTIFKRILGVFLPLALALRGGMFAATIAIRGVTLTLGAVVAALTLLGGLARDALNGLLSAFKWIVRKIMDFLGISSPSKLFLDIGESVMRGFIKGVKGLVGAVIKGFKFVFEKAIAAAKKVLETAVELGRTLIRAVIRGAVTVAEKVFNLGKRIANWIADGIRAAATWVVNAIRNVWELVTGFFVRAATKAFEIGKTIVSQIASGIKSAGGDAVRAVRTLMGDLISVAKKVLGIHSPSKQFATIGKQMVQGLVKGVSDNKKGAKRIVDKMFSDLPDGGTFSFESRNWIKSLRLKEWWKDPSVNKDNLPNTIAAKKYGIQELTGGPIRFSPTSLLTDVIKGIVPGLASGGIVSGSTLAEIGERGREAVIPLNRAVLRRLGQEITASMAPRGMSFAASGVGSLGGGAGTVIQHQEVHLPAPPSGGLLDPRYAASQFAREMTRRGGR